ncbi:glycine-rich domain-containing protein [Maritimibacter alexandrii]|uniref:glycine-rich domain-containing protein n=1 Tax=Maritimibacter alexandrii TaxID=2570355 RepID=UPI001109380D|nr:hypothetical protein [Maritimibacter alexandrii]
MTTPSLTEFDTDQIPDPNEPETFHAYAFYVWNLLSGTTIGEINAALVWMSALLASLENATNALEWVTGTAYEVGDRVWSPIDLQLYQATADFTSSTDPSLDSSNWDLVGGFPVSHLEDTDNPHGVTAAQLGIDLDADFAGRLIAMQVFDTAGSFTYTPTVGAVRARAQVVGAGGGGGGADGDTTGSEAGSGGGGGAGAEADVYFTLDAASYAGVCGAGGTGGNGGTDTNGSNGGLSSLMSNGDSGAGLTISVEGGYGAETQVDTNAHTAAGGNGGNVTTCTGTSILASTSFEGNSGSNSFGIPSDEFSGAGIAMGGDGAGSRFGEGEKGGHVDVAGTNAQGFACEGNGGGGSGAAALGAVANADGGDGADGIIVIFEYSE